MKALDKLRAELHQLAQDVAQTPHKLEEVVDSHLLTMRNRRFTAPKVVLILGLTAFFSFVAGAAFQAWIW